MENRISATESRPDWDDYFLGIAQAVAKRSECLDKQVGCVIVDVNNRILGTGYNGMPPGVPCPCTTECIKDHGQACPMVHAELNAMLYSDMSRAYAVYCTLEPCTNCRRHIDACGVQRVVVAKPKYQWKAGPESALGMTISTLFQQIAVYHRELGYPTQNKVLLAQLKDYTQERELLLALSQEVAELTDSYPWKPWKKEQKWDRPNTIEEMVDILFFLGALMELGNISATEICDTFGKKLKENYNRIQRGYNKEMK